MLSGNLSRGRVSKRFPKYAIYILVFLVYGTGHESERSRKSSDEGRPSGFFLKVLEKLELERDARNVYAHNARFDKYMQPLKGSDYMSDKLEVGNEYKLGGHS